MALDPGVIPLSLYVHFPWCVRKCPYCDFNSHPLRSDVPDRDYLKCLLADLDFELDRSARRSIDSVFFGGGTPSLMAASTIGGVIEHLARMGRLSATAEITLEANPGTLDASRFRGYRQGGVNRLSIGVQSFNDRHLQQLGRIHDGRQARRAYDTARDAGFDNINIDLMFGLPGQTERDALMDIESGLRLQPEHLSYYQLTLEPNTLFYEQPPRLPDDETTWSMQNHALGQLRDHGYYRYEVSAFSQSGKRCRHNENYWSFGDYIGIGAGAHGKITDGDAIYRYSKPRHPKDYLQCETNFRLAKKPVDGPLRRFEFMLNALRLQDGFTLEQFRQRTGLMQDDLKDQLSPLLEQKMLRLDHERIRATELGYWHLDSIIEKFLPEESD